MPSPGVDPKIRSAGLDIVAALPQIFVDHIAELEALFQRRSFLEESPEIQLFSFPDYLDPRSVQEIGSFHQRELQALAFRPAEVTLLIKIGQGLRAEADLVVQ